MKGFKAVFPKWFLVFLVIALLGGSIIPSTQAQDIMPTDESGSDVTVFSEYYSERYLTLDDGSEITESIINGPSTPPLGQNEWINAEDLQPEGVIANFPSYNWVFGCTAVSAAMIAAYHDRTSWPNIYTGPTNGGVMPLNNVWGTWTDRTNAKYPSNPLIASQNGVDGRTSRGSIDDYWVSSDSTANDPFITGGWTEHTYGTAIGDYMRTSQSRYQNPDGATAIYNYNSAQQLTCATMASNNLADGNLGRMLFYQKRGYEVTSCYNQITDNQVSGGFSLAQFKAEIDAGFPVMVNLEGHTMVGYGYSGSSIYIRDTWDNDPSHTYTMAWGGSYEGMRMHSISVLRPKLPGQPGNKKLLLPLVFKPQTQPPADYTIKNWNFEQGHVSWTEYSQSGYPTIYSTSSGLPSSVIPTSGSWAAWIGGSYSDVSSISQQITAHPQKRLTSRIYIVSQETSCTNDYFYVKVNGNVVFQYGLCDEHETGGWGSLYVNLTSYGNQKITVTLEVRTNGSLNSNVFMDDFVWETTLNEDDEVLDIMEIIPATPAITVPESALPKEQ